ncbi:Enoyl-CoA hydratase/carnithine racemase [Pseudonocardia thermophila]|jgi:Enoyl-CoA hydratase/carnithine racemase|uniref:Enoyl-CoA hydratase/carnithine racemase n=1 Tax=Pseudonocardia thermophila TaxID=1848 RepID=A0A1M6UWS2_PSETH|nr:enoyl-CoA hydratase/isomerase family protein [Pseudonocardia thermophila]SHK73737.1 Enoyl-CoA hydratase/carnithine racemase [Pseudonocardia thermophila]
MTADLVKVESDGPIRILTLNRPEALNSFDDPLKVAFIDTLRSVERDPDARAIVLTGAGKAFSAGGDISNFENRREFHNRFYWMRIARAVPESLMRCHLPVVAAINGPAVGLGCSLALLSDIVVIADTAFLADPHVNAGLVAGDGGAVLWPLLVGYLKAKEYLLLGERIPAEEAVRLGLANRAVPKEDVLQEALGLARRLAELSPHAVQETKKAINLHIEAAALRITPFALAAESESFVTDEVKSFIEKFTTKAR